MQTIAVRCLNLGGQIKRIPAGTTLEEAYPLLGVQLANTPTSAKVNNKVVGLHYPLFTDKDVEYIDITDPSGMRTYTRSLFFVLYKAVTDCYPDMRLRIETPVAGGYCCRIFTNNGGEGNAELTRSAAEMAEVAERLRNRMAEIVKEDLPFHHITCPTTEAIDLFRRKGLQDKVRLLEGSGKLYTTYYTLGDLADYYYGSMLTHTGQLHLFDLEPYGEGLLLRLPSIQRPNLLRQRTPQPKLYEVFREQHHWQDILGVTTIGDLNLAIKHGHANNLINVSEALQEKKIIHIADMLAAQPERRVVLIAGPSSSGKTTLSKRLATQLMASGIKPIPISLDDYFVDRDKTPRDEKGDYDFEHIEAMNIPLFEEQMNALINGGTVELPRYNFQTGRSEHSGHSISLPQSSVLILEGIHALNPRLTEHIPAERKFKIYASALTTILLDDHNYVPTTDNRLLRRIVRDHKYRGASAIDTLRRWPSVRAGEEKWIFPFQEEADVMVNTALLFELAALREQALPLLEEVTENSSEYSEAYRLCKFLSYVRPLPLNPLPPTSLLREFLGGSSFVY